MSKWRPNGLTVMGVGTQGNWVPSEKDVAQRIFDVVRAKAVFDAPFANEDPRLCIQSVDELQKELLSQAQVLKARGTLKRLVNRLVQACKFFKSNGGPDGTRFESDPQLFQRELLVLRQVFFRDINDMIVDYKVQV